MPNWDIWGRKSRDNKSTQSKDHQDGRISRRLRFMNVVAGLAISAYYFLQGLRSKADTDKDGRVTVKEFEEYVVKNVTVQAEK